jgi:hypothetical protein
MRRVKRITIHNATGSCMTLFLHDHEENNVILVMVPSVQQLLKTKVLVLILLYITCEAEMKILNRCVSSF